MPVFFNEQSLANVLSFKKVAAIEDVRITFDTTIEKAIVVHVNNITFKFKECKDGLYYFDMTNYNIENHKTKSTINNYSSQNTNFFVS